MKHLKERVELGEMEADENDLHYVTIKEGFYTLGNVKESRRNDWKVMKSLAVLWGISIPMVAVENFTRSTSKFDCRAEIFSVKSPTSKLVCFSRWELRAIALHVVAPFWPFWHSQASFFSCFRLSSGLIRWRIIIPRTPP